MRSPWLPLLLLFLYLLLVIVVAKLLDLVLWYQHGIVSTQLLDPLLLSVRQLKLLLDSRGVSYVDYFEKQDLVKLLEDSGDVTLGEMNHVHDTVIPLKDRMKISPTTSIFSGGTHFYEEVEDTRDSVWLVQVVTSSDPLLDDYSWRLVCSQLEPFAIRVGIFDCRQDQAHCDKKGWKQPLLLLAMPKGMKPKDKVVVQPFTSNKPQAIVDWVRHQLSSWVKTVQNFDEVKEWLAVDVINSTNKTEKIILPQMGSSNASNSPSVKVLLLSHLLHPPLFLAALSIKFTGRVRFGMLTVRKEETDVQKFLKLPIKKLPCYLVITPEKTIIYGHKSLEYFNLWSMNVFLRGIQPEMNDVFLFSLILVNMLVSIGVLMVPAQLWWKWAVHCLWILVSYNLRLFTAWLLILASSRSAVYNVIIERLLTAFRIVGLSPYGSVIRTEWALLVYYPPLLIGSFACYVVLVTWALQKKAPFLLITSADNSRAWWEVLPVDSYWVSYLFRPMASPMASLSRQSAHPQVELEDGIDMLIERLAVPNFWLQPVISIDYIKDLPFWQFRGWHISDESPSSSKSGHVNCPHTSSSPKILERMMDGEEPQDILCRCLCSQEQTRFRSWSVPKDSPLMSDADVSCSCVTCSCTNCKAVCAPTDTVPYCSCETDHLHGNNSTSGNEREESDNDIGWKAPEGVLPTTDCAVCLEGYRYGTILCALPCGHNYHQHCILAWLQRDNHHCPVCRWPAYRFKSKQNHLHRE